MTVLRSSICWLNKMFHSDHFKYGSTNKHGSRTPPPGGPFASVVDGDRSKNRPAWQPPKPKVVRPRIFQRKPQVVTWCNSKRLTKGWLKSPGPEWTKRETRFEQSQVCKKSNVFETWKSFGQQKHHMCCVFSFLEKKKEHYSLTNNTNNRFWSLVPSKSSGLD